MKYTIICGSNREKSNSMKVSEYVKKELLKNEGLEVDIMDFRKNPLKLWTEKMWDKDSEEFKVWQVFSEKMKKSDAFVVVSPEYNGQVSPVLKNFLTHLTFKDVAHKPSLIISVSSTQAGGTYPISELRSFSVKNSAMLYIPDHVIVRNANNVLNTDILDEEDKEDFYIKGKILRSLKILEIYTNHLKDIRKEDFFDFSDYPFGM